MYDSMYRFFELFSWSVEAPKAYGPLHLSCLFGGLSLSIFGAWKLRDKGEKTFRTVMLICGFFLMATEVFKILFHYYYICEGSFAWWVFPFQLCSIPMYFCVLVGFLKEGRLRDTLLDFMLAFNLMSGFVAYLEPSGILGNYIILTAHSLVWHMMLVFVGLVIGFSGRAGRFLRDYRRACVCFILLAAIALGINFAFYNVSDGSINMFFIGPAVSSIIVFKDIAARFGWYVNAPIYAFCVCLAAFLFFLPFTLWHKRHGQGPIGFKRTGRAALGR